MVIFEEMRLKMLKVKIGLCLIEEIKYKILVVIKGRVKSEEIKKKMRKLKIEEVKKNIVVVKVGVFNLMYGIIFLIRDVFYIKEICDLIFLRIK